MNYAKEKTDFLYNLKKFASTLAPKITKENEWTIRGFIDIFKNVYSMTTDTKVISKILEIHLFPYFLTFADSIGYEIELAEFQNWYPDLTFINKENKNIKFAVDLKTTYREDKLSEFCRGFTLGSHGKYFIDRTSSKNIQYPYNDYSGHFCVGIIYSRADINKFEETKIYTVDNISEMPAIIGNFVFFAEEKWRIASDKQGSNNTANIGSIQKIEDIINGNGVFAKAGEELFDDYWVNYGKMEVPNKKGEYKKLSSFEDYLKYRGMPEELNNPKASKRKVKTK